MFKKKERLTKTRELRKVYRLGKTVHTSALVIKFFEAAKLRTAFVVSKKVSKKAVERNRIKRVLREFLRLNSGKIRLGDYIITAKNIASGQDNNSLRKEFEYALTKGYLWRK